jgi:hypothetical protein
MKTIDQEADKKQERDMDDPTESFKNSKKDSAAEINRGDEKSKTYMGKGGNEPQGPNWNKKSKDADGDTSQNAGVFK